MVRDGEEDAAVAAEALDGFPEAHARCVDVVVRPDRAVALALVVLNPDAVPSPMIIWLERDAGSWHSIQASDVMSPEPGRGFGVPRSERPLWAAGGRRRAPTPSVWRRVMERASGR